MARSTSKPKRLDFGVEQPITIRKPSEWDWNAWRHEPHGDIWLGHFRDSETALAWAKTQPGDITINNVPPPTSRRYITGDYTWGDFADGTAVMPKRHILGLSERPKRRTPAPTSRAPRTSDRTPLSNPFPARSPKPKVEETAEQKALKADAQKRLDQHKRDEAADIAAGKTEVR